MATTILGISDPHWSERRPGSRKDPDWFATMRNKIEKLLLLATKIQVKDGDQKVVGARGIQIAGDLFHIPDGDRISRRLDTFLVEALAKRPCPIYTIPGNHDLHAERLENLQRHPYGVLSMTGSVVDVCWPRYVVVGEDPPVILTGYPYVAGGPGPWLSEMAASRQLIEIKKKVSDKTGKQAYCSVMTHNHWGSQEGMEGNIYRTSKSLLLGTGIDVCHYGDPHTYDGVEWIQDDGHRIALVGPGAFIRGTLAEHDVNRKPMIMVSIYREGQEVEISNVPVPHRPAEEVFNLEQHKREKRRKQIQDRFIQQVQVLTQGGKTVEDLMVSVEKKGLAPRVLGIVQQALQAARESLEGE